MLFLHNHKKATLIKIFTIAAILPIATFTFGKILTMNSVSAVTHEIPEGYTTIVDPVFYDCVVKKFISEFPNESIAATGLTDQQLAQINRLVCDGPNQTEKITDSTGLEKMTSLTYLNLAYNDLSEIDVTKNTSLTVLNLDNNNLSEIDVTKNTSLTVLNLNSNNLSEMDVTKNTNLIDLYLGNNNLSEIDITQNTSLTDLRLYNNNLSEIDITQNTSLTDLRLYNNNLSEIDVTKNTNLTYLRLDNNNLSEIDVTKNTNLTYLTLNNNNLSEIDVTKNTNLTYLWLSDNNLSEIDVTKNTSLTSLSLGDNNLSEIDVTKNTNLIDLYLGDNNLSEIDVTKNTSLTSLSLGDNNLSEIDVTKNTNLTYLTLDSNNLSEIDVTKNTNLTYLWLSGNNLSEIDITQNTSLTDLRLYNNNLSEIDVTKNTSLVKLNLAGNSIFDFSSAENLTLDQYSSFHRQSQTIEAESTTYVLPPLFTQVKTEGWGAGFANPMYTDQPFILTNATLSADGKSITIINPDEPATIEIDGGMADGSILTINYTEPQEHTYTLSFNANGGTNAPAALTYGPTTDTSHAFTIPTTAPTYSGHTFLGWADTANATTANQDYVSGHTITINANKTLYAVWRVEEPEPEPGSEPEPEPESTAQVPDTGLITGDGQNGVNDYNTATFIPLLVIMLTSIHIILKIRAKILSKTH